MSAHFAGYFLAGALPRLSMFMILFVLARILDPAQTGWFVLVITVGEIVEMTAGTWLRIFILKEESGQTGMRPHRLGRLLLLATAMALIALLLAIPIAAIVAPAAYVAFAGASLAYIAAYALLRHAHTLLQALGAHGIFIWSEIARSILIFLAAYIGASQHQPSFLGPSLMVSAATAAIALASLALVLPRLARPRMTLAGVRPALIFGAPILVDTLLSLLIINFDRFVLNQLLGPSAVAIYALAYALGRQPIEFLAGPLNAYALPVLFAGYNSDGEQRAREIQSGLSITLFVLCAAIFTGILLLAEPIAMVALKPEYRDGTAFLMPAITLAACLLVFKAFVFDNVFHLMQKNREKMPSVVLTATLGMAATVFLVSQYGVRGAAVALILSSAIGLAASVITSRRYFVFPIPLQRFVLIALAAGGAGVALRVAMHFAAPYGDLAQIAAGFLAFCLCYALLLTLQGISLKALASTPWAPLAAGASAGTSAPETSAR